MPETPQATLADKGSGPGPPALPVLQGLPELERIANVPPLPALDAPALSGRPVQAMQSQSLQLVMLETDDVERDRERVSLLFELLGLHQGETAATLIVQSHDGREQRLQLGLVALSEELAADLEALCEISVEQRTI